MVAFASHVSAQDTTSIAPAPEVTAPAPVLPTTPAPVVAGKGSIGGFIGVPFFLADEDTKNGQAPRILGQFIFQYCFTPKTRLAVGAGYGWIGYKDDTPSPYGLIDPDTGDSVHVMNAAHTKFQPITATLLRSFGNQGQGWVPYAGAGVNLTRIEIVNKRNKIKDPATFDSYVNWSPGVQGQIGIERFTTKGNVSFDWNARFQHQFSEDKEQFPSGFTGPHTLFTINFGVHTFFWPIGHKPIETAPAPEDGLAPAPSSTPAPAEPAPAPAPVPPPPPPTPTPDTTQVDTTRAPGSSQHSVLVRHKAVPAPVVVAESPTAKAAVPVIVTRDERAICP